MSAEAPVLPEHLGRFAAGRGKIQRWPDIQGVNPMEIGYRNVILQPRPGTTIETRREPDPSVRLGRLNLRYPVIASNMKSVVGDPRAVEAFHKVGMVAATYPYQDVDYHARVCYDFTRRGVQAIYSVRMRHAEDDAARLIGAGASVILIDTAHGGMEQVIRRATAIKDAHSDIPDLTLIAGNITTYDQAQAYAESGVIDIARVFVGPGEGCRTKMKTGVGTPGEISAIYDMHGWLKIIADGGIKEPGDVPKALAAGAEFVMIGSMFAGTEESGMESLANGKRAFYGEASEHAMRERGIRPDEFRGPEGAYLEIDDRGTVQDAAWEITRGLRSAMSYVGAHTMEEFRQNAVFAYYHH
jgi:IMP dehydrogenase/GMP reductase